MSEIRGQILERVISAVSRPTMTIYSPMIAFDRSNYAREKRNGYFSVTAGFVNETRKNSNWNRRTVCLEVVLYPVFTLS